jgi:hypothetical protein
MLTLPLTTERPAASPQVYALYFDRLDITTGQKRFERFGVYPDAKTAFGTRDYLVEVGFRALIVVTEGGL